MGAPRFFPIRRKLILLFIGLVVITTAIYFALAVRLFLKEREQFITEISSQSVKSLALEVYTQLDRYQRTWDAIPTTSEGWRALESIWTKDAGIIAVAQDGDRVWSRLSAPRVQALLGSQNGPLPDKARNGSTPDGGALLYWSLRNASASARVWLALDAWFAAFAGAGALQRYLVDSQGVILAGPGGETDALAKKTLQGHPLLEEALTSAVSAQSKPFEWDGQAWVGSYASVGAGGLWVLAQIPEQQARTAAWRLVERSILVALFVLTLSILLARQFARGLTIPLAELVGATRTAAQGAWDKTVHVRSNDEVGQLARAFNSMLTDLRNHREQLGFKKQEIEQQVAARTSTLQQEKRAAAETQESMVQSVKLASMGELAGVTAHEVLNPTNNISIRIARMKQQQLAKEKADLELAQNITAAWTQAFQSGGIDGFIREVSRTAQSQKETLLAEDLQNLTAILGDSAAALQAREKDLLFLESELSRITRIVNQMRSLSRVGGNKKIFDIHEALDQTCTSLAESFQNARVELVKEYSAEPRSQFQISAAPEELVQVFSNLLRNAQHAVGDAQRRSGWVRVSTRTLPERVEIRIADNGVGINTQNQAKLFETQFTTKGFEKGTGLGLSISRRIARAFGGDLELAQTVEGQGTVFLVWFPRATDIKSKSQ